MGQTARFFWFFVHAFGSSAFYFLPFTSGSQITISVSPEDRVQAIIDNVRIQAEYYPPTTVLPTTMPLTTTAGEVDVKIFNPSFQADRLAPLGLTFINRAREWTVTGSAGTFLPPASAIVLSPPADRDQVGRSPGSSCPFCSCDT